MTKNNKNLKERPPVVVILGHIDSGKTTLLDQIRKTQVVLKESGGITQHIGAYQITKEDKKITFIDTPGHEAFSQMRSRGAKTADIAILVVDSCKGVEKQTKEVIVDIKECKVPLIVAINKVDRPETDPENVKRQLQQEGIITESLGGEIPSIKISAKTGKGVDELLEIILLVAEMEKFKADISEPASGVIIESYVDEKRGPTATIILNQGILKVGDVVATCSALGKIKILEDFNGKMMNKALPSDPAIILGLENVPKVGERLSVFSTIEEARLFIQSSEKEECEKKVFELKPGQKVLNLILKTDVVGSLEAIEKILARLPQEKIVLKILKSEVGNINESDVKLAKNFRSLILGFRTSINPAAKILLQKKENKVLATTFEIIYDLVESVRKFMAGMLKSEIVRIDLGKIKVLVTFWSKKNRQIVGGRIFEGRVEKNSKIEACRDDEPFDEGKMISLQRNKKDIEKALKGDEVGILYEGSKKIEKGDILIIFKKEKQKVEL